LESIKAKKTQLKQELIIHAHSFSESVQAKTIFYTVKSNKCLGKIAKKHNCDINKILRVKKGKAVKIVNKNIIGINWKTKKHSEAKHSSIEPGSIRLKQDLIAQNSLNYSKKTIDPILHFSVTIDTNVINNTKKIKVWTKKELKALIRKTFPENLEKAVMIASAESNLVVDAIGDRDKMFLYKGEFIGDSIGLFQIRTGGKSKNGKKWNRAAEHGMTIEQFREKLKDPVYNLKIARKLFNRGRKRGNGWGDWSAFTNKSYLKHRRIAKS